LEGLTRISWINTNQTKGTKRMNWYEIVELILILVWVTVLGLLVYQFGYESGERRAWEEVNRLREERERAEKLKL